MSLLYCSASRCTPCYARANYAANLIAELVRRERKKNIYNIIYFHRSCPPDLCCSQTCAMAKNQGPRSSRSRIKYTIQVPGFPRSRVKYTFQDPGFPRSHVKYTFQDPGFPGSHVQYTLQDPRFPRSHVRHTFQDPGFPRSHDKYKFQDPESSTPHNLESPRSHKYTFQDPESQDPMTSRYALQDTVLPRSHEFMAYHLQPSTFNLSPKAYHLQPQTTTCNLPPAGWVR